MKTLSGIIVLSMLASCGPDPEPVFKYTYTVINTAGFAVQMTCSGCEPITVLSDEEKVVKSNTAFDDYELSPMTTTILKLDAEETDGDEFTIRSYEYDLIYELTGDATSMNVTLTNAGCVEEQFNNVVPPATYRFRAFECDNLAITVTLDDPSESLMLKVLYREKLIGGDLSLGSGVVSKSIDLSEID